MNDKTKDILESLDSVGFKELRHCIELANTIQQIIAVHNLANKQIVEYFKIEEKDIKSYISGSYPYSIEDIAIVEHVMSVLEEEMENKKIKGDDT